VQSGQVQPGQLQPGQVQAGVAVPLPGHPAERSGAGEQLPAGPESLAPGVGDQGQSRPSYDPSSFPRRLPYETPHGRPPTTQSPGYESGTTSTGYAPSAAYPDLPPSEQPIGDREPTLTTGEHSARALPQRVPAKPDVPTVPEPPSVEPPAEAPALARIATHLRRGDLLPPRERQEGFDVTAILGAVREVAGVRGASLRTTPTGAHSLRLELSDGADPAEVSRLVARLLQDRMGLDAALQAPEGAAVNESPAAYVPAQQVPAGRATVSGATVAGERRMPPVGRGRAVVEDPPIRGRAEVSTSRAHPAERLPAGFEPAPARPLSPGDIPGPRVVIENVQVNTFGLEATVQVRLAVGDQLSSGVATGPAVDGYLLRLCAMATTSAIDELLGRSEHADGPARCFVEHAALVPFGASEVAVVVMLLSCGGWVEQLAGSAVVAGDDRHAMVRATLAAVNRRLDALLS
jgi:hypothetical protein